MRKTVAAIQLLLPNEVSNLSKATATNDSTFASQVSPVFFPFANQERTYVFITPKGISIAES